MALISFPITLSTSLENDSLKRLNYFGVNIRDILCSQILVECFLAFSSVILNIIVGKLAFNLHFPKPLYFITFLIQVIFCIIGLLLIGAFIALIIRNSKVVLPLGMILLFITYMVIGVFVTFNQLPKTLKNLANYLPIKYVSNDLYNVWCGKITWDKNFLITNTILCILFSFLIYGIYKLRIRNGEK
jgi:ABC-2 type transport system permease protein